MAASLSISVTHMRGNRGMAIVDWRSVGSLEPRQSGIYPAICQRFICEFNSNCQGMRLYVQVIAAHLRVCIFSTSCIFRGGFQGCHDTLQCRT